MAFIGQEIDRVDGRLKVTGSGRYAAEFKLPDVVHAVLVQSTIGAGAVLGFDLASAKAMPGVRAIITPENALKLHLKGGASQTVRAPLLQDMDVHYNGQHVAIVVADTLEQADAAADLHYDNGTSQSDGAPCDDRSLGRHSADDLDSDAGN